MDTSGEARTPPAHHRASPPRGPETAQSSDPAGVVSQKFVDEVSPDLSGRKRVAHGVSRGYANPPSPPSPLPPARERGAEGGVRAPSPRARALGYNLTPLPGLCNGPTKEDERRRRRTKRCWYQERPAWAASISFLAFFQSILGNLRSRMASTRGFRSAGALR